MGWGDYAATLALGSASLLVPSWVESPQQARWRGPVLFDASARGVLRLGSAKSRGTAATLSDALVYATLVHNVWVDDIVVVAGGDHNPDVAWQLLVIDAEAHALSLLVTSATKHLVARERPCRDRCDGGSQYSPDSAEPATHVSFYSGHASLTSTSAGLVCAHHEHLPLYGGGVADLAACLGSISVAMSTAALRVAADKHWVSDVLVGQMTGLAIGYGLPTLLFYRDPQRPASLAPRGRSHSPLRWVPLPWVSPHSAGIQGVGLF